MPPVAHNRRDYYAKCNKKNGKKSTRKLQRMLKKNGMDLEFSVALSGVTKVVPVIDANSFDSCVKCTMEIRKTVLRSGYNTMSCDERSLHVCIDEDCLEFKASLISGGNNDLVTLDNATDQMRDDEEDMSDEYEISSVFSFVSIQAPAIVVETFNIVTPAIV